MKLNCKLISKTFANFLISFSSILDFDPSTPIKTATFSNMAQVKRIKLSAIHEILPEEIFVMILKKLDYKSLTISRGTCKKWRTVIDGFELLSVKNFCKFYFCLTCCFLIVY